MEGSDVKTCCVCNKLVALSHFSKDSRNTDKLQGCCKPCLRIRDQKYRHKNREKLRKRKEDYRKNNLDHVQKTYRDYMLKRRYDITTKDYNLMLEKQGGNCAICKEGPTSHKYLSVDHCHTNGNVRGLLCMRCNTALGKFKDSADLLNKAIKYLEEHV